MSAALTDTSPAPAPVACLLGCRLDAASLIDQAIGLLDASPVVTPQTSSARALLEQALHELGGGS